MEYQVQLSIQAAVMSGDVSELSAKFDAVLNQLSDGRNAPIDREGIAQLKGILAKESNSGIKVK